MPAGATPGVGPLPSPILGTALCHLPFAAPRRRHTPDASVARSWARWPDYSIVGLPDCLIT
eukprot:5889115-Prymnesium_polylepis.3